MDRVEKNLFSQFVEVGNILRAELYVETKFWRFFRLYFSIWSKFINQLAQRKCFYSGQ